MPTPSRRIDWSRRPDEATIRAFARTLPGRWIAEISDSAIGRVLTIRTPDRQPQDAPDGTPAVQAWDAQTAERTVALSFSAHGVLPLPCPTAPLPPRPRTGTPEHVIAIRPVGRGD